MKITTFIPVFTLGFTIIFLSAKADSNHIQQQHRTNLTIVEEWQNLEKTFKGFAREGVKKILPVLSENFGKVNLSKECVRNTMHLLSGLKDLKTWAVQFLDSSAKAWDGLLVGTISAFGSFEECLDIKVNNPRLADKGKRLFVGQYCMIDINLPLPKTKKHLAKVDVAPEELREFSQRDNVIAEAAKSALFYKAYSPRLGICTPSGCTSDDIDKIVSSLGNQIGVRISVASCEVRVENEYTPIIIGVITYYSFLTLLFIAGTLMGVYIFYTKTVFKNQVVRLLLAFSGITNFKKFSNRHTESSTLNCLYGLRFLTMTWIVLNHSYLVAINRVMHGGKKFLSIIGHLSFQVIVNGTLQVDIYFFLGGLLLCYIILAKVKTQNYKFNIWMYIVHRIWRIIPCYTFVLMFTFLTDLIGSGPGWKQIMNQYHAPCYDNWWSNFLFINNFYQPKRMCWYHTWYVSADFQLYLFALVILLPMMKRPKFGLILAIMTIITSILYSAINAYVMNHPPIASGLSLDAEEALEFSSQAYVKPMTHASPYAIGILTGYLLYTKPKLKISPKIQVLGWCIAVTFSLSTLYGTKNWNSGVEPTVAETIFYAGLARTVFTLGIAWMIICCATGHAGFINYILSWEIFIPLARITFLAYLIHPMAMVIMMGNVKTEIQADHFIFIWLFFGHLCVSYGLAFVAYMLVELPFNNLEVTLLFANKNKEESVKVVDETNDIKEFNSEKNGSVTTISQLSDVDNKSSNF